MPCDSGGRSLLFKFVLALCSWSGTHRRLQGPESNQLNAGLIKATLGERLSWSVASYMDPYEVHTHYHWDQGSLLRQRIPCWHQGPWSYQNIHVMITVAKANRPDAIPAKTRRWPSVVLMLGHRLRRWPNIKTTLGQRLVLAGIVNTTLHAGPTLNQHWFGVYRVWKPIAQLVTPKIDRFIYTGLCSESSHVCNGLRFALGEICNKICSVSATKKIRRSLSWLSCEV